MINDIIHNFPFSVIFVALQSDVQVEPVGAGFSGLQEQQSAGKWDIYNGDVEDAEFAHVLDNLPTSYDDFESKVRVFFCSRSNLFSK